MLRHNSIADVHEAARLLEAAAKAAGIEYDPARSEPHPVSGAWWGLWLVYHREPTDFDRRYWNPLTDDGDCFRLAMKLRIWPDYRGCGESTGSHAAAHYLSIKGRGSSMRWVHEPYVPEEMFSSSYMPDRTHAVYLLEQGLIRGVKQPPAAQ